MTDELLHVLTRDPLTFAVQAYMLGFVVTAAVVLLLEPLRRWVWPAIRFNAVSDRSGHAPP